MKFNNVTLRTAVKKWLNDETKAEAKYGHISNWDVSNVTDMSNMFEEATSFDQPIGNWDVSKVTNMRSMFGGATHFNQDISNWDVSNVIDMFAMFYNATFFNQDLGNWDLNNVSNMGAMLSGTSSFNQTPKNCNMSKIIDSSKPMSHDQIMSKKNKLKIEIINLITEFIKGNTKYGSESLVEHSYDSLDDDLLPPLFIGDWENGTADPVNDDYLLSQDGLYNSYAELIIDNLEQAIPSMFTEEFMDGVWSADDLSEFSVIKDYIMLRGFDDIINVDIDDLWDLVHEVNILEIVLDELNENYKNIFKDINGNLVPRSRWKNYQISYGW